MQKSREGLARDQGILTREPGESGLHVGIVFTVVHTCHSEACITVSVFNVQLTVSSQTHPAG